MNGEVAEAPLPPNRQRKRHWVAEATAEELAAEPPKKLLRRRPKPQG